MATSPAGVLVGEFDGGVTVPLHVDHRDQAVRQDAFDGGVGGEIFKSHRSVCWTRN